MATLVRESKTIASHFEGLYLWVFRKSEKKIPPADIDGFIQGLRLSLSDQDNEHASHPPPQKGKWKTKASGVNPISTTVPTIPSVSIPDQLNGSVDLGFPHPKKDFFGDQTTTFTNKSRGSSLSLDPAVTPQPLAEPPGTTLVTSVGRRSQIPTDFPLANTTTTAEPLRKMINPDETRMSSVTTPPPPQFLVDHVVNPSMEYLDRWITRSREEIPPGTQPVINHRMLSSLPEGSADALADEWMFQTLNEALIFVVKAGSNKDIRRASAVRALLGPTKGRAGRHAAPVQLGGPIVCLVYSSKSLSIGNLFWTGIDFWEETRLCEKLRMALFGPG